MKTFEMKIGNKIVSFTAKSVTIDGTEYPYAKMSGIKHSAEKHIYAFKFDGAYKYLPYDPKYAQVLGAIFKQVDGLDKKRKAAAAKAEAAKVAEAAVEQPKAEEVVEEPKAEEAPAEEVKPEEPKAEELPAETAEETPAEEAKAEEASTEAPAVLDSAAAIEKPVKKAKFKKSVVVFLLIIAFIAALTAGYFALFGTSSNPTAGPNSTDSQQYDDIDALIEDLD